MKMIGEILTAEQMADLASIMPNAGNAILELTEDQLDFLRGYIDGCKILNQKEAENERMDELSAEPERIQKVNSGLEIMLTKAQSAAETWQRRAEAELQKWVSASNPPEKWHMDDEDKTFVNYLVSGPDYGVDIGNYVKPANMWIVMGLPAKVTHWMPLPEPPEVDANE